MSCADIEANSRFPRAMAAGSVPCLKREPFRLICTSNSPGALLSSDSLNTVHILPCQSSGTAGVEIRNTVLAWPKAGTVAAAPRAAAPPKMARRLMERESDGVMVLSPEKN